MVNLDWNKILTVSPEDLTEQDKDDLYDNVLWYEIEPERSKEHVNALFRITQEILKYKGEQVESLLNEIDNLAARQGEDEAQRHQSLLDEIEDLQNQLAHKANIGDISDTNIDEIQQDLVRLSIDNERLANELQNSEKELLSEKRENEKLASQVIQLEQEKNELQNELAALQRESAEQDTRYQTESPAVSAEKQKELIDTVRQKNKHITQLLNDIEAIEKENNTLRLSLAGVRDELAEATEDIKRLTGEVTSLTHSLNEQQDKMKTLEDQNEGHRKQVVELVTDKNNRDKQLDQLGEALDARLAQWQDLLVQKDSELTELKQRLVQLSAQNSSTQLDTTRSQLFALTQTLETREQQIEELQKQLEQATDDINRSSLIIKQYKARLKGKNGKNGESSLIKQLKQQLIQSESRIQVLEVKAKNAEDDAQAKAEEMTEMVIQLREYESGVYGLSDAVAQIKELKKQKKVRDRHIEQLVQAGNQLQSEANQLEEENLALRAQLGIDTDAVVRIDGVVAQRKAEKEKLAEVMNQLDSTEEIQLQLRMQIRKLSKQVKRFREQLHHLGVEPEVVSSDEDEVSKKKEEDKARKVMEIATAQMKAMFMKEAEEMDNRLQDVIDENEALRKGMHEILDSVHKHNGSSVVHIESACLERLLEALDSRHISGWYHPAMRLQAQLNMLEGSNAALREQLRIVRLSEAENISQLQKALYTIEELEKQITEMKPVSPGLEVNNQEKTAEEQTDKQQLRIPTEALKFIEALKTKKSSVIKAQENEPNDVSLANQALTEELNKLKEELQEKKEFYDSDRESWLKVREGLQQELDKLNETEAALTIQIKEYTIQWEKLQGDPDSLKSTLAENTIRLANLGSDNEKLKRKCSYLQETESKLKCTVDELREELFTQTNTSNQRIGELIREKMTLIAELKMTQTLHEDCVGVSIFEDVQRQLNQLSVKHRDLIQRQTVLDNEKEQIIKRLQNEIESLTKELDGVKSSVLEIAHASEQRTDSSKDSAALKGQQQLDKQRIEHTERMYKLVKDQLNESEERCSKLEKELAAMVQQNLAAQLTEAELRHQLIESVPHLDFSQLKAKLASSDKQLAELQTEKLKLEESLGIAEKQVEEWKKIRHCHDYQHDALQRQVLELTAASEDKATIGRLSRELLRAQESELAATQQASDLQDKLKYSNTLCESYQKQIRMLEEQLNTATQRYIQKNRLLFNIIHELHHRYLGSIPLVTADILVNLLLHAQQEKYSAIEYARKQLNIDHILEELQVKGSKSEKEIRSNERLQELKLRIMVESLESKLSQAEEQFKRQENLLLALQQEIIIQDQMWEKKQLIWEQIQVESLRQSEEAEITQQAHINEQDSTNERQAQNYKENLRDIVESPSVMTAKKLLHWKGMKPVRDLGSEGGQHLGVQKDKPTPEEETYLTPKTEEHKTSNTTEDGTVKVNGNKNEIDAGKNKELKVVVCDTNGIEYNEKRIVADSELSSNLKKQLSDVTAALNEQTKKLANYDADISKLKAEVKMLKDQLIEKERELQTKEKELMDTKSSPEAFPMTQQDIDEPETTELLALKATVANVQNIVNQKEETIGRYQTLLKESRDEHSITVANLQQELQSLQETLEKKELLLSKLKNEDAPERGPAVKVILEKYLIRVHELEDEISQLKDQCAQFDGELTASQQQVEKWAHTAEERLKTIQEMKQKLEGEKLQGVPSEMSPTGADKKEQIDRLNELVSQLKAKLENRSAVSVNKERMRSELERCKKRLEIMETRNSEDKAEIQRLRQQINARARSTPRPEHVTSAREEALQKRVHVLEEQLAEMEKHEEKERLLRKSRCMEEFDKWETRKRWQASTEKLKAQLQEKSFQVEALRGSYERCKYTVARLEKEKITLETKLKTEKGSMVAQALVEELEKDRLRLQEELRAVRKSSELAAGSTSLTDVIEAQERRIAALQLAQKGECALAEEVERLQERKSQLQKCNLRLEAENLELKLQLERLRTSDTSSTPRDPIDTLSDTGEKAVPKQGVKSMKKRGDLERAVVVLKRVVEKLQAENKKLHSEKVDKVHDKGYVEKLQIELQKCQENYLDAVDKNSTLESELKEAKTKIMLFEKEGLGGELAMVKVQLAQKCSLLSKIKALLESAVVREKALREQVAELQKLIPPDVLDKVYNKSRANVS